jgi:hypothetical protein
MHTKRSVRQEVIQWALAIAMAVGGLVVWRLTSARSAHAQEVQPDATPLVEGCGG